MNLDDLEALAKSQEETTESSEVVEIKEDEIDDDYEDSAEADLSTALSMLEDCHALMDQILKTRKEKALSPYLYRKLDTLSLEVMAFILQYDIEPDQHNKDWKEDI